MKKYIIDFAEFDSGNHIKSAADLAEIVQDEFKPGFCFKNECEWTTIFETEDRAAAIEEFEKRETVVSFYIHAGGVSYSFVEYSFWEIELDEDGDVIEETVKYSKMPDVLHFSECPTRGNEDYNFAFNGKNYRRA